MRPQRPRLWRARLGLASRLARSVGHDLVRRSMYSPVPEVPNERSATWSTPHALPGVALDVESQLDYLESALAPYVSEFDPPLEPGQRNGGYYLLNDWYGPVDAELLYATVRHWRPTRMLELGAGYSTLVSAAACAANAREGHPCELVAVDPDPRLSLSHEVPGLTAVERRRAQDVPLERFLSLESGDVLFMDTSHTVKLGSELNYVVLDVLPRLREGVLVHFHDVFLPYEYPRAWLEAGAYLTEQYLLHAFIACNPSYELLFAAHAVARADPARLRRSIPTLEFAAPGPMAFWLRRTAG